MSVPASLREWARRLADRDGGLAAASVVETPVVFSRSRVSPSVAQLAWVRANDLAQIQGSTVPNGPQRSPTVSPELSTIDRA